MICTPKVRYFWRCMFLWQKNGQKQKKYRNKETNNSRNGHSTNTMKTSLGDMELDIPRDCNGESNSQLIMKHQTTLYGDIEEKIIKGMTENDIAEYIEDIYDLDVSNDTISSVTGKIFPIASGNQDH